MKNLILSALLASGLTVAGAGVFAADEKPQEQMSEQQQGSESPETYGQEGETAPEGDLETTESGESEYVVQEGDTLASIAKEQLGSESEWNTIAEANSIENPDQIAAGQKLVIPASAKSGSEQDSGFFEEDSDSKPAEDGSMMEDSGSADDASESY